MELPNDVMLDRRDVWVVFPAEVKFPAIVLVKFEVIKSEKLAVYGELIGWESCNLTCW